MTKLCLRWILASMILAVAANAGFACDGHDQNADAKNGKAVAEKGDAKGCDMPCCAHANEAANVEPAASAAAGKPCAGHDPKGCPKKAAVLAKADAPKDAPKPEAQAESGTQR